MSCPDEDELAAFVDDELAEDDRGRIRDHMRDCEACRVALSVAEGISRSTDPASPGASMSLAKGTPVGRFLVLEPVGQGAMGQVYSAFDPALDRRVALKFLNAQAPGDLEDPRAIRLLREARAMATLAHPNVVTVHDVGVFAGHPYVAMEYIEGATLRGWLEARSRSAREILEAHLAAGAGLVAAHDRGLVHRDFKPDNVLVGKDGRVCVTDFGLVRWAAGDDAPSREASESPLARDAAQTRTGALVGTPAYMAPEQLRGGIADARSDQFSFCVALWEALTGRRPFHGRTAFELLSAIEHERPNGGTLSRSVAAVLARGLAYDPDARHESMQRLLSRLQPGRRNVGWIAAGTLAAIAGGVGFMAANRDVLETARPNFCASVADRLADVWGPSQRATLASALRERDAPPQEAMLRSVLDRLDTYASRWHEHVTSQCRAETTGQVPTSVVAVRMACLQRRLDHAQALVDALADAGPRALDRAVAAADKLPSLEACLSEAEAAGRVGLGDPSLPPRDVARIDAMLARAKIQMDLGWLDVAAATAEEVVPAARELGHKGLLSDTLDILGRIRMAQGKLDDALAIFVEATESAVASRHHRAAYVALANRAYLLGGQHNDTERADELLQLARAELDAVGGDPRLEADSLSVAATLETRRGDYAAAVELYERVLAKRKSLPDVSSRSLGIDYANLGTAQVTLGHTEEGIASLLHAERELVRTYGPRHRTLIGLRGTLLSARLSLGADEELVAQARQAVADATEVLGEDHAELAILLAHLSRAELMTGSPEAALEASRRALAILIAAFGERHPNVASERVMVATTLRSLGRHDEALAEIDEMIAAAEPEPSLRRQLAEGLDVRSTLLVDAGEHDAALVASDQALAIHDELLGADSVPVALTRQNRALVLLELGRVDEGLEQLDAARQAMAVQLERGGIDEVTLALTEARLAMALSKLRPDDPRIATLADASRARLKDVPTEHVADDEAWQWLSAQPED